jgi:hypothetical protein
MTAMVMTACHSDNDGNRHHSCVTRATGDMDKK